MTPRMLLLTAISSLVAISRLGHVTAGIATSALLFPSTLVGQELSNLSFPFSLNLLALCGCVEHQFPGVAVEVWDQA